MAAVKTSPPHSSASPGSSPEAMAPEQPQMTTQKRKGGRKPVYATQEERKMRNRAAQAAFRERRTEYIKHLEATIKHHEEQLSGLQQSSRTAADEVLMLRYKNSLLERILLEKGIDVHTELRAYTQYDESTRPGVQSMVVSHAVAPVPNQAVVTHQHPPISAPQQQIPRQVMGRQQPQQQRRSTGNAPDSVYIKTSPTLRAVSNSRASSPSVAAAIPTPPDQSAFQLPQSATTPTSPAGFQHPGMPMAQSYYPSPYQAHMEELEQEYDRQQLLEDNDDNTAPHIEHHTSDGNDSDMSAGNMTTRQHHASSQQQGLGFNVGNLFENSFDSMFSEQTPNNPGSLTDMMRQYNHAPFSFATSSLR